MMNHIDRIRFQNNYQYTLERQSIGTLTKTSIFIMILLFHQAVRLGGINFSFADIFLMFSILFLIWENNLFFPINGIIFFSLLVFISTFSASFFLPFHFFVDVDFSSVIVGFLKSLTLFFYFLIGYSLSQIRGLSKLELVKWYSYIGVFSAAISLLLFFSPFSVAKDFVLFSSVRLKGFMNDPNYFAALCVSCLPYILNHTNQKPRKTIFVTIILLALLGASSKTGIIILFLYYFFRLLINFKSKKKYNLFIHIIVITLVIFLLNIYSEHLLSIFPVSNRLKPLFTSFTSALTEGGSSRLDVFDASLQTIEMTPFLGTGFGAYQFLTSKYFKINQVSHNSYLQITAEWGIPIAFFFFAFLAYKLSYIIFNSKDNQKSSERTIAEVIVVLLFASLGIALNNARMFWFFLGFMLSNKPR